MSIGNALKYLRKKRGYTQAEVAEKVGIKRTTYNSYENSKTVPPYDIVEKLADLYDVTIQEFDNEMKNRTYLEISSITPSYQVNIEEKMEELTSDERMVIKYLRLLSTDERREFFNEIKENYLDRRCYDDLNE